jgi:hypothetical protein
LRDESIVAGDVSSYFSGSYRQFVVLVLLLGALEPKDLSGVMTVLAHGILELSQVVASA